MDERAVPDKPSLAGLEDKWGQRWEQDGTYRFDRTAERSGIFSIDTPPPTVSGSLHMGSVFGYVQTDAIARYQRMQGKVLFYPMGWDDNGVPTERRVENYYGVRCDPSLPYDDHYTPPEKPAKDHQRISRRNFIDLCHVLTAEDEQVFERIWRTLGLSVDWSLTYATIDDHSRRVAQTAFLRNLERGEAYSSEAPTLWDTRFRMAVAQAELEDHDVPGAYHRVAFHRAGGGDVFVETTRPELLPACVALVAHPDDERYRPLFGTTVTTPLFEVEVPVHAHPLADPEKGSGIAMICTFGDTTNVTWWRELDLPVRSILDRGGRLQPEPPDRVSSASGRAAYGEVAGTTVKQAQARVVDLLAASGELVGEPRPIVHAVKFYERGDAPLEIVTSRQWYIRNGGRDPDLRKTMLDLGRRLGWHPPSMRSRYDSWVEGLNGDWLVSRQRFFGVPIPLWYPVGHDGRARHDQPLIPRPDQLPVDPSSQVPDGFEESQRGQPGGFIGDPDVMDTWATSSLTPQIATSWATDDDLFARTFPMDLRPQGPEIIRTWLFSSVLRSYLEHGELPWRHATINGWVLDPDRKKMSKSKGNVVTPMPLLEQFGADAVRYWAANGAPGTDTAADPAQMKVGRRLAIKLLNASKFAINLRASEAVHQISEPLDQALLVRLAEVVDAATAAFDAYHYTRAIERTEAFFWPFCDDYVELAKTRAYGSRGEAAAASARASLGSALSVLQRLFAPFLPFVTEEVWSWWQQGSVHRASWPQAETLRTAAGSGAEPTVLSVAADVLGAIRRAKSDANVSMRAEVFTVHVTDTADRLAALRRAGDDVREAGRVDALHTTEGDPFRVEVTLADAAVDASTAARQS